TFAEFQKHIPHLKSLGVDIIWLMPIHPIGELKRKGGLGSYYSIKDYRGINPEFGDRNDFKRLVDTIHEAGMLVILDWVAGHTAWDHPWVTDHPDWYLKDSDGDIIPPNPDWTDVAGLDFSNAEMLQALEDDMSYWIEDIGVDGFRCDAAYNISIDFWKKTINRLNETKPVYMLAESDANHKGGYPLIDLFDSSYGWHTHHLLNEIARGNETAKSLTEHLIGMSEVYSPTHAVMNFTSNHDENSWQGDVFERLGPAAEVLSVLTYVMPGMQLIYGGQEFGLDKRLAFFEKDLIEKKDSPFLNLFTKLNKLKETNRALDVGDKPGNFNVLQIADDQVIGILRSKKNDSIVFYANLSPNIKVINPENFFGFSNVFTGNQTSSSDQITLPPWVYVLLENK
ncbi:MAG: alpha-amylase family glycosyl hydrolase, partial [Flavobacteriales bacterium]|nr:alpha-amylase family glycosyl hydrolase [Flavobacteriales bacterium]